MDYFIQNLQSIVKSEIKNKLGILDNRKKWLCILLCKMDKSFACGNFKNRGLFPFMSVTITY